MARRRDAVADLRDALQAVHDEAAHGLEGTPGRRSPGTASACRRPSTSTLPAGSLVVCWCSGSYASRMSPTISSTRSHLVGVITLFAAIGLVEAAGIRLRRAATVTHIRIGVDLTRSAPPLFPVALLTVLGSGLFMTADSWSFTTPWVVAAIVCGRGLGWDRWQCAWRVLRRDATTAEAAEDDSVPHRLSELIAAPALWVAVVAPDAAAVGILGAMATKPGWTGSIVAVAGLAVVGAIAGFTLSNGRRQPTVTAHPTRPGS